MYEALHASLGDTGVKDALYRELLQTCDFAEFFSGKTHPLTTSCFAEGLRTFPPIDISIHPYLSVLNEDLFVYLLECIELRRFSYVHLAPPCTTFSIARHPSSRSVIEPAGFSPRSPEVVVGNQLYYRAIILFKHCHKYKVPCSLEHPSSAYSWLLPQVKGLLSSEDVEKIEFDVCAFEDGSTHDLYKKPTA